MAPSNSNKNKEVEIFRIGLISSKDVTYPNSMQNLKLLSTIFNKKQGIAKHKIVIQSQKIWY
jgi:hypothetical protein